MMTFVLAASWLRKRVWFVGLIVTGGICGTLVICEAQQTKGAKSTVQKDGGVRKLQPADIAGLPPEFVEKLNARGCTIPQFGVIGRGGDRGGASTTTAEPTNVIHGEFARHGQEDWAVLCSKGGSSTIVIYWGKTTSCPASLARLEDAHYLKRGKDKTVRYWRSIRALGESDLGDRPGIAGLKPMAHQGIDDRFVGKSLALFYCSEGKWKIFPAKDSSSE
jgi:plasmid stabilization system protein ParE